MSQRRLNSYKGEADQTLSNSIPARYIKGKVAGDFWPQVLFFMNRFHMVSEPYIDLCRIWFRIREIFEIKPETSVTEALVMQFYLLKFDLDETFFYLPEQSMV
jgi:hypothetical protein